MPLQRRGASWRSAWILGLICCSLFTFSNAANCAPPPISVPVGNVTLSTRNIRRGVEVSVGTPAQSFAFMPGWYTNNTYLYGTDGRCQASDWSASACTTFRGGGYDASASKSKTTPSADAHPADASPYNAMTYIADTLKLNDDVSVTNFPMGVAINDLETQSYYPQVTLGMASNSTLLSALKSSGKIASRTYSFFAGRFGRTSSFQSDGAMAFGGYDRAKVTGKQYTTPLTPGTTCSTNMVVSITGIVLNFPNGTDASLFDGSRSESINACIAPSLPVFMNLPLKPYFAKWLTLSNSSLTVFDLGRSVGLNFWNMRYLPGYTPYNGDVTLKFLSGLSVRLPNEMLIVPEVDIDQTSGALYVNSSGPNFLINSGQDVNANDMAALGSTFLSVAYLMVNQDAGKFSLWAANPTTKSDLVAVDATGAEVTTFCTASTESTTATSTSTSTAGAGAGPNAGGSDPGQSTALDPDSAGSSSTSRLSTAGIAGVAVGGVAAAVLIGAAAFWWLKRRKKAAAGTEVAWDPHHVVFHEAGGVSKLPGLHEIEGRKSASEMPVYQPPLEMPASPAVHYIPAAHMQPASEVRHEME